DLVAGRGFIDADTAGQVAIVNQRFAERLGLGPDIIGRRIRGMDVEIVGVVADTQSGKVTGDIGPQVFRPARQGSTFYIRGAQRSEDLLNAVRDTAARVDPIVPIRDLRTMEQQFRENIATERFVAGASTAFAALATV